MHIQLIDSAGACGYQLRDGSGGASRTKMFSAGMFGGLEPARQVAQATLECLAADGVPHGTRGMRCDNTSGVNFVYIVWKPGRRDVPYFYAEAHYYDAKGHHRIISRSLNKHGAEAAIRQVLKVRKLSWVETAKAVRALLETYNRVKG